MRVIIWSLVVALHCIAFGSLAIIQGCGTPVGDVPPPPPPSMPPRAYEPEEPRVTQLPPATGTFEPAEPVAETVEYRVQKGDTLSGIAYRFNIMVSEIIELNNIKNKDVIVVGQKLDLPSRVDLSSPRKMKPKTSTAASPVAKGDTYVVQPGDCLSKIAVRFGTSVGRLREANSLASDKLLVGQKLKVPGGAVKKKPAPPPAARPSSAVVEKKPEKEVVKETDVEELSFDVVEEESKTESSSPPPGVTDSGIIHVVQPEENLESIARLYAVTVEDLAALNEIESGAEVAPGTRLKIP